MPRGRAEERSSAGGGAGVEGWEETEVSGRLLCTLIKELSVIGAVLSKRFSEVIFLALFESSGPFGALLQLLHRQHRYLCTRIIELICFSSPLSIRMAQDF